MALFATAETNDGALGCCEPLEAVTLIVTVDLTLPEPFEAVSV